MKAQKDTIHFPKPPCPPSWWLVDLIRPNNPTNRSTDSKMATRMVTMLGPHELIKFVYLVVDGLKQFTMFQVSAYFGYCCRIFINIAFI